MKLLIVDDEELTRTGVISSIDWHSLGIDEVLQADDGINGLETARIHKPEIVLCDVRMPRMTGIAMLEQLEKLLPDTIPIFMSGYSDKEYLKAAIRLKAVSYIEKPLDPREIQEAVLEAANLYRQKQSSRRGESAQSQEKASRLSLLLSAPYQPRAMEIGRLFQELFPGLAPGFSTTCIVVRAAVDMEPYIPSVDETFQQIRDFLSLHHMECIYAEKRVQYLIHFIFSPKEPSPSVKKELKKLFVSSYQVFRRFYVSAGETVSNLSKACQSYTSAVIQLQSSFFFPNGTFLSPATLSQQPSKPRKSLPLEPENRFLELLLGEKEEACLALLDELYAYYRENPGVLPNEAKDLYYKLFRSLNQGARQLLLPLPGGENIVDTLEACFSFQELHNVLSRRTARFFQEARGRVQENSTIFHIKDYISKNYMNESLSVKDISSHVFLSPSYVCTFFKNETGRTLNQYLTEYRMEKARQLLCDPRHKISEISSRVGYSDGNYFGKSFKKHTGLSPSEYREKNAPGGSTHEKNP